MSVQDAAIAVPKYSVDKVFATDTKTFSIADTVATKFNSFTTTGISTIYDFVAVYSVDGTNWLDVNGTSGTGGTGFTARSTAVAATMWPDGTISMTISQRALINGGSNWTLYVRIAYLVRYDTTTIASNLLTTDKFLYSSRYSYMKIAVQGSFSVSSSSASSTTIAHNLGYIPMTSVWILDDTGNSKQAYSTFGLSGSILDATRVDATNLYINTGFRSPTVTLTLAYKIYHEAQ